MHNLEVNLPKKQTISKAEEETDDVLDLGVTVAFDDLVAEEDRTQSKSNDLRFKSNNITPQQNESKANEQTGKREVPIASELEPKREENIEKVFVPWEIQDHRSAEAIVPVIRSQADLREKLREKAASQRGAILSGNGQSVDDDECEEAKERRNRFQNERVMVPTKMNHEIPDSLENVVTFEEQRPYFRRDRVDRIDRGDRDQGDRGDRRRIRGRIGVRYDQYQTVGR